MRLMELFGTRPWTGAHISLLCLLGLPSNVTCARAQSSSQTSPVRSVSPAPDPSGAVAGEVLNRQLVAVSAEASPETTRPTPADPVLDRGRELFNAQCVVCHGQQGDGQGEFAYLMNPRPRNFMTGKFKLATTQNQIPSDEDLLSTIRRGMPGSAMPPWSHLPKSDLIALVKYIRSIHSAAVRADFERGVAEGRFDSNQLSAVVENRTRPGPPLYVPPEPPFDDVRWFRGRRIYLEACASCHGADGEPVAEAVKFDDEGYPVPPRSFINGIFKGGSEGHQLYARIVKGLKGTPMPSYEGAYSDEEMWDLIHYVQSLAREGAQQRAQLRQRTIVAPRIKETLPTNPLDPAWDQARPVFVAMTPLWWTKERVEGLIVQALHDDKELAVRLSWIDPTMNDRTVRHDEFRDAVAIQFSLSSDPPFYMGDRTERGGVNIWMWKADRQTDLASGYQDVDSAFPARAVDRYAEQRLAAGDLVGIKEWPRSRITEHEPLFISAWGAGNLVADPEIPTSVESLVAHGPGTLANKPANMQFVEGYAAYERGVWYVQMQRAKDTLWSTTNDERVFKDGDYLPLSFAVWNGSAGDRDGKKNISIWQKLVIE